MVSINSSSKYSSRKNSLLDIILEEYYYYWCPINFLIDKKIGLFPLCGFSPL